MTYKLSLYCIGWDKTFSFFNAIGSFQWHGGLSMEDRKINVLIVTKILFFTAGEQELDTVHLLDVGVGKKSKREPVATDDID